jgi:hypothetical protein
MMKRVEPFGSEHGKEMIREVTALAFVGYNEFRVLSLSRRSPRMR